LDKKEVMENIETNKIEYCPYCNADTQYDVVFPEMYRTGQSKVQQDTQFLKSKFDYGEHACRIFSTWKCRVCRKLLFIVNDSPQYGDSKILFKFPTKLKTNDTLKEILPENVLEDFVFAVKCFEFGEYRASAAMCSKPS